MAEFSPVTTVEELILLDNDEITEGYFCGLAGWPEPGNNRTRSFWHGWRNGAVDGGYMEADTAARQLAHAVMQIPGGFQYAA